MIPIRGGLWLHLGEGDTFHEATMEYPWRISDVRDAQRDFGFRLDYANGSLKFAAQTISEPACLSFTALSVSYIGVYSAGDPPPTLLEQSTQFLLNGTVPGLGWFKPTVPGVIAHD